MVEGRRHNYLKPSPFDDCIAQGCEFLGCRPHPKIAIPDVGMWYFQVPTSGDWSIELSTACPDEHLSYTFSSYIQSSIEVPAVVITTFGNSENRRTVNFQITNEFNRFELAQSFSDSPSALTIKISGDPVSIAGTTSYLIGFALVSVEEGLFASSPIPVAKSAISFRAGELVTTSLEKRLNTYSGTLMVAFSPYWSGPELGYDASAYIVSLRSTKSSDELSVIADGKDFGRLKAVIRSDGVESVLSTDVVPIRNHLYAIALRWIGHEVDLLTNGKVSASGRHIAMPTNEELLDQLIIGSNGGEGEFAAFATFAGIKSYTDWLNDQRIRADIYEDHGQQFPDFFTDWHASTVQEPPKLFTTNSWAFEIAKLVMGLPRVWQENAPAWLKDASIDEGDCRDEIHRTLKVQGAYCSREYHSDDGRTDLLAFKSNQIAERLRFEFKVWGRHDYKEVPRKPLKYFTESECLGIVVMINPNKSKDIGDEYRKNVSGSGTNFVSLISKPFDAEQFPDHFISVHRYADGRCIEILHVVINKRAEFSLK